MSTTKGIRLSLILVFQAAVTIFGSAPATADEQTKERDEARAAWSELHYPAYSAYRNLDYATAREGLSKAMLYAEEKLGIKEDEFQTSALPLAQVYEDIGRTKDAEAILLKLHEVNRGIETNTPERHARLLAKFYSRNGNYKQAEKYYREVYALQLTSYYDDHPEDKARLLCGLHQHLGMLNEASEKWDAALNEYQACLDLGNKKMQSKTMHIHSLMANALAKLGEHEKAEALLLEIITAHEQVDKSGPSRALAEAYIQLGDFYIDQKKYAQADEQIRKVFITPNSYGSDQFAIYTAGRASFARLLMQQGKQDQVAKSFEDFRPNIERIYGLKSLEAAAAYRVLAGAYRGLSDPRQVQDMKSKADTLEKTATEIESMTKAELNVAWICHYKPAQCNNTNAGSE